MRLLVQKFGGTSVGNAERIRNVARRLVETHRSGSQVVAVVSAMSGVTDSLIKLAREVSSQPNQRELDVLLASGEHASSALVAMAVNDLGQKAVSLTGAEAGILTDRAHTRAKISNISPRQVHELLAEDFIVVVAGFQGQSAEGEITTFGRGGSDLTAIALAGALNADACQIYTDVDGVFTGDPRIIPDAEKMEEISYDELLEMAGAGSKVMQSRAVEFAKKFGVEFEVRSSLHTEPGTFAKEETPNMEDVVVRGVSLERNQGKVTISGLRDAPGLAGRIFSTVSSGQVSVDMIVQNVSATGLAEMSFTVHEDDLGRAHQLLSALCHGENVSVKCQPGMVKLSVVGIGMRSHSGVAAKLFSCLGSAGINIEMISTSEIKIAVAIASCDANRAAALVHKTFRS